MSTQRIFLVRHGETEWSLSGKHTGITDIPLTARGREAARRVAPRLLAERFENVLVSPLARARETCELAGFGASASVDHDLCEWRYGLYEGKTPQEIRATVPDWLIFRDGCPEGETPAEVGERADRIIAQLRATEGNTLIFSHGHLLRVLGARWLGLDASSGSHLLLETATISVLSYYYGVGAIERWNDAIDSH